MHASTVLWNFPPNRNTRPALITCSEDTAFLPSSSIDLVVSNLSLLRFQAPTPSGCHHGSFECSFMVWVWARVQKLSNRGSLAMDAPSPRPITLDYESRISDLALLSSPTHPSPCARASSLPTACWPASSSCLRSCTPAGPTSRRRISPRSSLRSTRPTSRASLSSASAHSSVADAARASAWSTTTRSRRRSLSRGTGSSGCVHVGCWS
jgi:hypothetical protein